MEKNKIIILLVFILIGIPLIIWGSCSFGFVGFGMIGGIFGGMGGSIVYGLIGAIILTTLSIILIIWIIKKLIKNER